MTWVVVARERDGWVVLGAFLVDAWCLGVKEAYAEELSRAEFDELLGKQIPAEDREEITPACAKKLVEGACAFAQALGFLPHRDFRKARKVLSAIDGAACQREFRFGHEGHVHFVAGPDDDDARVRRVWAVLEAKLGAGNFAFTPYDESAEDDDTDWEAMDALFRYVESPHCPDRTMDGFFASGFVSAGVMIDGDPDLDAWWREFFGGAAPELPDNDEFNPEVILDGWEEEWRDQERKLELGRFEPELAEFKEGDDEHFSTIASHCRGVLRVLDPRAALLAPLMTKETATALANLRRFSEWPRADEQSVGRRSATPIVAAAVETLWRATAPLREQTTY